MEQTLHAAGALAELPLLGLLVPVGLSFYTFEAINYLMDVYRGRLPAERDPANFLLFILFFPHLIAGPIVQPRDFLPQTRRPKRWDWLRLNLGLQFVLLGLLKKLAVADRMALVADPVFANRIASAVAFCGWRRCRRPTGLWRLQRLQRPGYRLRAHARLQTDAELPAAVSRGEHRGLLAAVARLAVNMVAQSYFHPSGRQSRRSLADGPQRAADDGPRWAVARGELDLRRLGRAAWCAADRASRLCFLDTSPQLKRGISRWRRGVMWAFLDSRPGTSLRIGLTFLCSCLTLVVFRCTTLSAGSVMLGRMLWPAAGLATPLLGRAVWLTAAAVALGHVVALRPEWRRWGLRCLDRCAASVMLRR